MADKKKPNYRDVVEVEVKGLGKALMFSSKDKLPGDARTFAPGLSKRLREKMPEGDSITLQDADGRLMVIPRYNIPVGKWQLMVSKAKRDHPDSFIEASTDGDKVYTSESEEGRAQQASTKERIKSEMSAEAEGDKQKQRLGLLKAIMSPTAQFAPDLGINDELRKNLREMEPEDALDLVEGLIKNAEEKRKSTPVEKPKESEPRASSGGGTGMMGKFANWVQDTSKGAIESTPDDPRVVGPKERAAIEGGSPETVVAEGQRLDTEQPRVGGPFVDQVKRGVSELTSGPNAYDAVKAGLKANAALLDNAPGAISDAAGAVKQGLEVYPAVMGYGVGSAAEAAGGALGMPNLQNFGQRLADTSTRVGAEVLTPPEPGAVTAMGGGVGPKPVGPALDPNAPVPLTPEQQAQQQAMSMAATMPGGFQAAGVDPAAKQAYRDATALAAEQGNLSRQSIKNEADALSEASKEAYRLNKQKMDEGEALALEASLIKQTHAQEAARYNTSRMATLQAAREAASQPTDPNRFWNNKSDGQKASAVIAGALFGFTGQGMQWLQRLDGLVEQDMKAQMADRSAKVQGLRDEAAGLGEAAQFAMQQGATLAEAKNIERASKYESAKAQLEMLASRTQNAQVQMRAQEMIVALTQKDQQNAAEGVQLATAEANMKNNARAAQARLAQQKVEFGVKMGAGGAGGGKLEQIRGPQAFLIADLQDAIKTARNMSAEFKSKASGFISKLSALDPTGTTSASAYDAKRGVVVQLVGRALEGGVLREGDIIRYNQMIPKPGDLRGDVKWDQLIKELEQRVTTVTNTLNAAGFDVGRVQQQVGETLRGGQRLSTEREAE